MRAKNLVIALVLVLLNSSVVAGEIWVNHLTGVYHFLNKSYDFVQGNNNKIYGIQYRDDSLTVGGLNYINSYGDNTNSVYIGHTLGGRDGFSITFNCGLSKGYKPVYYSTDDYGAEIKEGNNRMMLTDSISYLIVSSIQYNYKNRFEIGFNVIGFDAVALSVNLRVF